MDHLPDQESGSERLHVRIAHSGLASRRRAEQLIGEGRVTVNGIIVRELGQKVSAADEVHVDGQLVRPDRAITVALNKPVGIVTTLRDPWRRPTVAQYIPAMEATLKPVGRLDKDSEGLLLLTSDGTLAHRLAHPRFEIDKEYVVNLRGTVSEQALTKLKQGIYIEGGKTKPAQVEIIAQDESKGYCQLRFVLHEGRKRQIRLMCQAIGAEVVQLKRVRIGPVNLRNLKPGEVRVLTQPELQKLMEVVGLKEPGKGTSAEAPRGRRRSGSTEPSPDSSMEPVPTGSGKQLRTPVRKPRAARSSSGATGTNRKRTSGPSTGPGRTRAAGPSGSKPGSRRGTEGRQSGTRPPRTTGNFGPRPARDQRPAKGRRKG